MRIFCVKKQASIFPIFIFFQIFNILIFLLLQIHFLLFFYFLNDGFELSLSLYRLYSKNKLKLNLNKLYLI